MIDVDRVRGALSGSRFGDVRLFDQLDSTNAYLVARARAGDAAGAVAVADYQTAGRGRLDRRWESPPGTGLLLSVLFRPEQLAPALSQDRWYLLSLSVALAAIDACGSVARLRPGLKWPNDLVVGDAKLAGVLAEAPGGGAVVVGIGLNVSAAPAGATSLEVESGAPVERGELLVALLHRLDGLLGSWDAVIARAGVECVTIGRQVRVKLGGGRVLIGQARALEPDGSLAVADAQGRLVTVRAGDVIHLRGTE